MEKSLYQCDVCGELNLPNVFFDDDGFTISWICETCLQKKEKEENV
jgi:hypothetical protein